MSSSDFSGLGLDRPLLASILELGYEVPTPIQARSIPVLLAGSDLIAQAQTGTGKTAAFALPALSRIDLTLKKPQVLVLAPTRELAIQVAEAFKTYSKHLKGFLVTPIYGGQSYQTQLSALKRGPQVIVGTPGRVIDHLERKTLSLADLKMVVLDEADEMLNMGFVDSIEEILSQAPESRQTALFSATMPAGVKKLAKNYQRDAQHIAIEAKEGTIGKIEQQYIVLNTDQKNSALLRVLEGEAPQATIIFVRTKIKSAELAQTLQSAGYGVAALNGDVNQSTRERVIQQFKKGGLDIIVATDVAARGIDVERVSHVINYDIPFDVESYVHRIGRTGRAGRSGKAILMVNQREMRMLKNIERTLKVTIERVNPPSHEEVTAKRNEALAQQVSDTLEKSRKLGPYRDLVQKIAYESGRSFEDIAAALAYFNDSAKSPQLPPEKSDRSDRPASKSRTRDSRDSRDWGDRDRNREGKKAKNKAFGQKGQAKRKPAAGKKKVVKKTRAKSK
ncbi:MAG: ATP-dependent RNA helicase [Gammaproteobacteria bacterium CG11_big_fil_rev_8_21_14_0_20_46_22]|nr:MAG: ATP-dependent RNA helicase [Gammaproteobacteria bacterium CG12_big_fil_rev_8_21_14_0_65_46_12]PIR11426.1 MAG: ATP-dependent RNA helicase [Gammaproteobacteria bacterium CG11_big_fil_rev_8_21_14_0_20_46_22]